MVFYSLSYWAVSYPIIKAMLEEMRQQEANLVIPMVQ